MSDDMKKIALLSNFSAEFIALKLRKNYDFYIPDGFGTWVQEALNPAAGVYSYPADAVIVILDGTEARAWKDCSDARERITIWKQAFEALTENIKNIPVFVSTIDIRENKIKAFAERKYETELENDWYQFIQSKAEEKGNVYVLDVADIIKEMGRERFYSNKIWYMSSMPYSREGLNAVSGEIDMALNSAFKAGKKIIALDLDNTLWGGVIGEDGPEGIELSDHKEGQRYYDFQRQLLEFKKRGILLAVNSKNNPEDVSGALKNHPYMLLGDDDFVNKKINWNDKAQNLKAMEEELNLTEGSFIFIDDNPAEREIVKGECPGVTVPDFPADTSQLLPFAEDIWRKYCRPLRVLGEDLKKTEMYAGEARRKQEMKTSLSLDEYISKLEMCADIHRVLPEELDRVAQLCGKTNQFNLTTKRYTRREIEDIAGNPANAIYVVYVSDKYGDSGLVSVLILTGAQDEMHIDTFLMSCRVMGRKLENVIIEKIARAYEEKTITAEFIPTEKNAPVTNLYDRLGFSVVSENDGKKKYRLFADDDYLNQQGGAAGLYKEVVFEKD